MSVTTEAPGTPELKEKAIALAASDLDKEFDQKNTLIKLGNKVGYAAPHIPTGIYSLDRRVIQIGGIPRGRITEIFGTESGGKTTLTLQTIGQAQRLGGKAAFIDAEHALDPNWCTTLGVDMAELFVSQPDYGEQAIRIAERLLESQAFDMIVIDSVAALVPRAELEGDIGDSHMGLQARLMSQAMRKLTALVYRSNTALVFINQIREKIGVTYGSNETTTGGRALKFFASLRLDVRRIQAIKDGDTIIGNKVRVKAAKNKVGAPFREAEVDLMFHKGFDAVGSYFDAAVEAKVIEKSGAWYSFKGDRLGQGKQNCIKLLEETPELIGNIKAALESE